MVSAHPRSVDIRLLCRNRRTSEFVFLDTSQLPTEGELVAVRYGQNFRVEIYNGQSFVGVVVPAIELAATKEMLCPPA